MNRRSLLLLPLFAIAGGASAQQILINAAGATFPYPMYSKWFDGYHKKFPKLAFNYQSKFSKQWETKVGRGTSVNWPVGLGGKGNEGVAGQVQQTPNSIGYVELIYAVQNKMKTGKVKNLAGGWVQASLEGVTAAAASSKEMPDDFRVSITNAPGKDAYPISSFTWLLVPEKIADPAKKKAIKDFLVWSLKDGQAMCEPLSFAKLPKPVVDKETKAIAKIQ